MTTDNALIVTESNPGARRLSPTDISQFVRLEQCERYLRLRMEERAQGARFFAAWDVAPQPIPPLLSRSGRQFETRIEAAVAARWPSLRCGAEGENPASRPSDNARLLEMLGELAPG